MISIQQCAVLVGKSQGLPLTFDGTTRAIDDLETNQKLALTSGIGAYIRANPDQFTDGQVATAKQMTGQTPEGLADAGFSIGDFLTAAGENAKSLVLDPLVNVGESVSAAAKVLPLVLIAAGLFILWQWTKKTAAYGPPAP